MTNETIKLISLMMTHLECSINLYGMIHKDKLADIFCHHYPEYHKEDVLPYLNETLITKFIHFDRDYYVHEVLYFENLMQDHLETTYNLPYYVPILPIFLKYEDSFYYEITQANIELKQYLKHILPPKHQGQIDDIIDDIILGSQMDLSLDHAIFIFERYKLPIKEKDKKSLVDHVVNLYKQTRTWVLHGFTKNEMKHYQKFGLRLPYDQLCDCKRGKTYGTCCYESEKPFLNQDETLDHRFQITEEMIGTFRQKLMRESDRIIFYHSLFKDPSLKDLINHFLQSHAKDIIRERPKDVIAALFLCLMELHDIKEEKIPLEAILRSLGNWSRRGMIEDFASWMQIMYYRKPDTLTSYEDLQPAIDAYFKDYPVKKEIIKGYTWLEKSLDIAEYNEEHVDRVHDLVLAIKDANHPIAQDYFKLILKTCPTAFLAIAFILEEADPNDHMILLRCYVKAFEICHEDVLSNPPKSFTHFGYNKEYILALDSLGLLYKEVEQFDKAMIPYQKMIQYDDEDRFGAKESILICFIMTGRMEDYEDMLFALPNDSLYRKVLMLYHKLMMGESFYEEYLVLLKDHHDLLDVIVGLKSPEVFPFHTPEGTFLYDFYQVMTYQKEFLEPLIRLHKGNIKPIN